MPDLLLYSLPAFLDHLALITVLGVLSCRLWVLPQAEVIEDRGIGGTAWVRLRRLLGMALVVLTVTGFLLLAARALQMSRQPPGALPEVLPTVLMKTHYGRVWLIRTGALVGLWLGWWGLRRTGRTSLPALMFGGAAIMVWSYSATGHAADWGDFTWTEWLHWLHVLSASLWAGGLLAFLLALFPVLIPQSAAHKAFLAETMHRLSVIAVFAVIGVWATGLFNAAVQLGSVPALWETGYGRMLAIKGSFVLLLMVFWSLNRFAVVPVLRAWLAAFRRLHPVKAPPRSPRSRGRVGTLIVWHRRLMIVEAVLFAAVLLCAVLLALEMPPRQHAKMMKHAQIGEFAMPHTDDKVDRAYEGVQL